MGKTIIAASVVFSEGIFLNYPALPRDRQAWGLKGLYQLHHYDKLQEAHIQASISADSSAKILSEALRLSGRGVDRQQLISVLEQLDRFAAELTPPISYSVNQHMGLRGHISSASVQLAILKKPFRMQTGTRGPNDYSTLSVSG